MNSQPDHRPEPPSAAPGDPLDLDPLASVRDRAGQWLPWVSVVELVSVLVLFGNRFTIHLDVVTSVLGPVHGALYLATITCALLARVRWPAKVLAVLPVVGGVLSTVYAVRRPLPVER